MHWLVDVRHGHACLGFKRCCTYDMERADVGATVATFLLTKAGGANAEADARKRAVAASVNFILKSCVVFGKL